jgi:hypothetical protein
LLTINWIEGSHRANVRSPEAKDIHRHAQALHWGDVGDLEYYASLLKRVTDSAFKEGEHAE